MSWLKTGLSSTKALAEQQAQQKLAEEQRNYLNRFWLGVGEEARITFVDGDLIMDQAMGQQVLSFAGYHEHHVNINGSWGNHFVCLQSQGQPCPICESGDRSMFVAALTIIDHRVIHSQKTPGKVYKDEKKLFVASPNTILLLQQLAVKRGGLAGCTFDVTRTTKKDPRVGNLFDFIAKTDMQTLQATFVKTDEATKQTKTYFVPAEYENELPFKDEQTLRSMGFGYSAIGVPQASSGVFNPATGATMPGLQQQGFQPQAAPAPSVFNPGAQVEQPQPASIFNPAAQQVEEAVEQSQVPWTPTAAAATQDYSNDL